MKKIFVVLTAFFAVMHLTAQEAYPDLYLRGQQNGWGYSDQTRFLRDGSHYSLRVDQLSGEFKIATADWVVNYGADTAANGELAVEIGSHAMKVGDLSRNYACQGLTDVILEFDYVPDSDLELKVTSSAAVEPEVPEAPALDLPQFYLRGQFNNWSYSDEVRFVNNGTHYSLHVDNLDGEFKISTSDWAINYGSPSERDGEPAVGAGQWVMQPGGKNYGCNGISDVTLSFVYKAGEPLTLSVSAQTAPPTGMSGTLPVLYINVYADADHTVYNNEVIDYNLAHKEYFTEATYWLDLNGCEWMAAQGAASIGSEAEQLPLQLKARGNYTRTGFSKKPFKLKLGAKQGMLGLSKSKHFAILAHADDYNGYLRNFTGFNLGRRIGLPWTPAMQPVEVVINGDYRGLYFLTESIRIEKDRINISELVDECTEPSLCSGGYLVELDNYEADNQIIMEEKTFVGGLTDALRVTFDTPEVYSDLQRTFITDQFTAMNEKVGACDESLWSYLDMDDAVRYYIVCELMSHLEAYHGSTYLFRDRGEGQKWHYSPLWDFGMGFNGPTDGFIYDNAPYGMTWIASIRCSEAFNSRLADTWRWFMSNRFDGIYDDMTEFTEHLRAAARADRDRWAGEPTPEGGNSVVDNTDLEARREAAFGQMRAKVEWLRSQFGDWSASEPEPERDTTPAAPLPDYVSGIRSIAAPAEQSEGVYDLLGRPVGDRPSPGIYVSRGRKVIVR